MISQCSVDPMYFIKQAVIRKCLIAGKLLKIIIMQFCLSGHFRQIPHFFQSYICFISIRGGNISCKLFRLSDTGQVISIKPDIRSGFQPLNQMIHIIVQSYISSAQTPRFIIVTIIYQMTNRISFKSGTYSIPR